MEVIELPPNESTYALIEVFASSNYEQAYAQLQLLSGSVNRKVPHQVFALYEQETILMIATLYFNEALSYQERKVALFGNYEALEVSDEHIAFFFSVLEKEAYAHGASFLIGPMNGSSWENYRLSEKLKENYSFEPIHKRYYHQQLKKNGFREIEEYYTHEVPDLKSLDQFRSKSDSEGEALKDCTIGKIDLNDFNAELAKLYPLFIRSFEGSLFFSPLTEEEFIDKFKAYKSRVHPELTIIAKDKAGNYVGCYFSFEDPKRKGKTIILKTIARDPHPKFKGLGQLMGMYVYKQAKELGYKNMLHAFMHSEKGSTQLSLKYHGDHFNTYYLYGKEL